MRCAPLRGRFIIPSLVSSRRRNIVCAHNNYFTDVSRLFVLSAKQMNTFVTQVPSTVTHTHDEDCSDEDEEHDAPVAK